MTEAFQKLCRAVEQGRQTVLRPYGATNVGEFFAVCTEAFFFNPIAMQSQHSDLYDVMRVYYGQDTAERFKRVAWHRS